MPPHAPLVPLQGLALLDDPPPKPPQTKPRDTPLPGPPMPLSPPGRVDGQIGTADEAYVADADPLARWVLICQARADTDGNGWINFWIGAHGINEGDQASLYLVRGSGAGERVEGLITRDHSGRWLVVGREDGQALLLDLELGTSVDLFPSMASINDELYPLKPSTVAIDPSGQYLLYRRLREQRIQLVVRHLNSGVEQLVDPGPGTLLSATWRSSAWLRLRIVREDLNGDHRVELPEPDYSSGWVGTCGLGSTTYMAGSSPDIGVEHVAWSTGQRVGTASATLGDELLVTDAGNIVAVTPSGARRTIDIAPGCRPIFGDPLRAQVLADCGDSEATVLEVFGPGGRRMIGRVDAYLHELRVLSPRLLELNFYDSIPNHWLDLEVLRLYHKTIGYAAVAYNSHALIRGERDIIVDLAAGRERAVLGPTYLAPELSNGRYAFARPWLVDLERGKRVAKIDRHVHAVTSDGRLLVDTGNDVLRWRPWKALGRSTHRPRP
jgi:hypothetical protein